MPFLIWWRKLIKILHCFLNKSINIILNNSCTMKSRILMLSHLLLFTKLYRYNTQALGSIQYLLLLNPLSSKLLILNLASATWVSSAVLARGIKVPLVYLCNGAKGFSGHLSKNWIGSWLLNFGDLGMTWLYVKLSNICIYVYNHNPEKNHEIFFPGAI